MNIDFYRVFLRVAKTRNITAAAEQLGYTQSGVSHIIMQLENEFGFPLLIRSKTGVRLTHGGERLLPLVQDVIDCDERLRLSAREFSGLRTGKLRIGAFSSAAASWLPSIIKEFNSHYPEIEFDISIGTYETVERLIMDEEIDCGFMTGASIQHLYFYPLKDDRMLALLPENHPLAGGDFLPLEAINGLDFIMPAEGSNYDIGHILRDAGIAPRIRFTVSDDYAAVAMVRAGLGMTIMPELILSGIRDLGRVMELRPACVRTIGIAARPNAAFSPACKAFLAFVKSWASRL